MLSVGPGGRVAAAGVRVGGGLIVTLRGSCWETCFRPSNSEPGTARRQKEREQGELTQRGPSKHEFLPVGGYGQRDSDGSGHK